jgi:sulfur carrier protein
VAETFCAATICEFTLNGEPFQLAPGSSLDELVITLSLQGQALALAVNRTVVPRRLWGEQRIAAGDRIEVVRAIGGG